MPATSNGRRRAARRRRGAPTRPPPGRGRAPRARSFTSAPSVATRFSPSRIGLTRSTSARRSSATERGKSSSTSSRIGCQRVGAEPLVDVADLVLDPLPVGAVAGHVRPRRVGVGHEHDPLAVLGVGVEQLAVGLEPAQDVLRQLDAVDAPDHESVLHDLARAPTSAASHSGDAAAARMSAGSDAEGRDERRRVRRRRAARAELRKSSAHRWLWKPHARCAARPSSSSRAASVGQGARATPAGRTACGGSARTPGRAAWCAAAAATRQRW